MINIREYGFFNKIATITCTTLDKLTKLENFKHQHRINSGITTNGMQIHRNGITSSIKI